MDVSYLGGSSGNLMMTEKGNDNSWIEVEVMRVPANFFSFMNIPLEQGRAPKTEADIVADRTWQQRRGRPYLAATDGERHNGNASLRLATRL